MKKTVALLSALTFGLLYANDGLYYIQNNQKMQLKPYKAPEQTRNFSRPHSVSSKAIDYYINDRGTVLGVTRRLIVKLNSGDIERYLKAYHLTQVETLGPKLYLVEVADKRETIPTANALCQKPDVEYAHPDFIKKQLLR